MKLLSHEKPDFLTTCRHCGWHSEMSHVEQPKKSKISGIWDWCHACGRVASKQDFCKERGACYKPAETDVFLGTRTISFRVHAKDPRLMGSFAPYWEEFEGRPGWNFDPVDNEIEFFHHMIGKQPLLKNILNRIALVEEAKIPTDGVFSISRPRSKYWYLDDFDNNSYDNEDSPTADETQAIILRDQSQLALMQEVLRNSANFGQDSSNWLCGDISAKWDHEKREGHFRFRFFIKTKATQNFYLNQKTTAMARFFAVYYGLAPFRLSELCVNLRASTRSEVREIDRIPVPPFSLDGELFDEAHDAEEKGEQLAVEAHNKSFDISSKANFALDSGTGSPILGGTCCGESATDLKAVLFRFFREIIPECTAQWKFQEEPSSWFLEACGMASTHRCMRKSPHDYFSIFGSTLKEQNDFVLDSILSNHEFSTVLRTFKDAHLLLRSTGTLVGLMNHLENRGHAEAPYAEGLTVELLPFQLQSLQWALERETVPGGIQSFWWATLPTVKQPNTQLYYNPILGRISSHKPRLVRGGILAEAMGLGKTVICLALILQNPAPVMPESGSHASSIPALDKLQEGSTASFRDPDLYGQMSTKNPKRGSIVSKGTLVVCNASLVGQWVAEAKSKLKNPGLVYSYYGHSRNRDPVRLAKNSIVVTTYETLSSDMTYHASKSVDDSYCAPCEQVRWWRIICDESHVLRDLNTSKTLSVISLVADNKWLVSGTPINTNIMDLQNQLIFLGIQLQSNMMDLFKRTLFLENINYRRYVRDRPLLNLPGVGMFTFFMRSIMMRHSHEQKYSGTQTTLMSLPPKTERVLKVDFLPKEREEYDNLESAAKMFYESIKAKNRKRLGRYFLKLFHKLTPMRIACSGGKVPLYEDEDEIENGDEEDDVEMDYDGDNDDHVKGAKKKRATKEKKFSDFAFTSKLQSLIHELKNIRQKDNTSKCLVFSQFQSTLNWLKEELPEHGFQYRCLSGEMTMSQRAKALRDFQNDPPTTIFLLSMRAGAVGINLTQANVVFLMEPCFNPALEAQAVGRVWRLGQQRPVEIVRLQMKDSIEGRICQMLEAKYNNGGGSSAKNNSLAVIQKSDPNCPNTLLGSLRTDKSSLVADEFDLLFGLDSSTGVTVTPDSSDDGSDNNDLMNDEDSNADDDDKVQMASF